MSQQVRFSPSSRDVVYWKAGMVVVQMADGHEVPLAPGHHPAWLDAAAVAFCPPDEGVVQVAFAHLTRQVTPLQPPLPAGNTLASASGKVAVHRTDPRRTIVSWNAAMEYGGETDPALSSDGRWMATSVTDLPPGLATVRIRDTREINGWRDVYVGAVLRPRFSVAGTSLAWQDSGGQVFGLADAANPHSPVVRLSRPDDRLYMPVPLWVPERGELFLLALQDHGNESAIVLLEWGSCVAQAPVGYELAKSTGSGYDHDVKGAA